MSSGVASSYAGDRSIINNARRTKPTVHTKTIASCHVVTCMTHIAISKLVCRRDELRQQWLTVDADNVYACAVRSTCKHVVVNVLHYISRSMVDRMVSNIKSDLQGHSRPLLLVTFDRPYMISYYCNYVLFSRYYVISPKLERSHEPGHTAINQRSKFELHS